MRERPEALAMARGGIESSATHGVDPFAAAGGDFAPRLQSLAGTVGVLFDISKPRGVDYLDRIEVLLRQTYRVQDIVRARKRTFTKPAPDHLLRDLAQQADFVILGVADCGSCNTCTDPETRANGSSPLDSVHTCGLSSCVDESLYFEERGIPTTVVATAQYAEAARAQATHIGLRTCPMVTVRRSILRLVREQVSELADETISAIVQHLTAMPAAPAAK